jgi:hypothetical protein
MMTRDAGSAAIRTTRRSARIGQSEAEAHQVIRAELDAMLPSVQGRVVMSVKAKLKG